MSSLQAIDLEVLVDSIALAIDHLANFLDHLVATIDRLVAKIDPTTTLDCCRYPS